MFILNMFIFWSIYFNLVWTAVSNGQALAASAASRSRCEARLATGVRLNVDALFGSRAHGRRAVFRADLG